MQAMIQLEIQTWIQKIILWGTDVKEATGRQWQLEWIKQYNTDKYWNRAKTFEQYGY